MEYILSEEEVSNEKEKEGKNVIQNIYLKHRRKYFMKIIYIMGAPAIGKTYISTKLAKELNITSLVNTDVIRAAVRKYVDEARYKELLMPAIVASDLSDDDLNKDIYGFMKQAELLKAGVFATLKCLYKEDVPLVIIEGIHILPSMISELSEKYEVLPIILKLDEDEMHYQRMISQGEERAKYKLLHKERARAFQKWLIDESSSLDVTAIENLEERKVIDEIVLMRQE
jgi:2-phosphoglycerate kinase